MPAAGSSPYIKVFPSYLETGENNIEKAAERRREAVRQFPGYKGRFTLRGPGSNEEIKEDRTSNLLYWEYEWKPSGEGACIYDVQEYIFGIQSEQDSRTNHYTLIFSAGICKGQVSSQDETDRKAIQRSFRTAEERRTNK